MPTILSEVRGFYTPLPPILPPSFWSFLTLSLLLPLPPSLPASLQATSTDPYHAPPAPLVPAGVTGQLGKERMRKRGKEGEEEEGEGGREDEDGGEPLPFDGSFVNNIPVGEVPREEGECVGLEGLLAYLQSLPFYRGQVSRLFWLFFPPSLPLSFLPPSDPSLILGILHLLPPSLPPSL